MKLVRLGVFASCRRAATSTRPRRAGVGRQVPALQGVVRRPAAHRRRRAVAGAIAARVCLCPVRVRPFYPALSSLSSDAQVPLQALASRRRRRADAIDAPLNRVGGVEEVAPCREPLRGDYPQRPRRGGVSRNIREVFTRGKQRMGNAPAFNRPAPWSTPRRGRPPRAAGGRPCPRRGRPRRRRSRDRA